MLKNEAVVAHSIFNLLLVTHPEMLPYFHYYFFIITWKPLPILPPLCRTYFIMSLPLAHMASLFPMKNLWKPILFLTSVLKVEA